MIWFCMVSSGLKSGGLVFVIIQVWPKLKSLEALPLARYSQSFLAWTQRSWFSTAVAIRWLWCEFLY